MQTPNTINALHAAGSLLADLARGKSIKDLDPHGKVYGDIQRALEEQSFEENLADLQMPLDKVSSRILRMMRSYPGLYPTRVQALLGILNSGGSWENGEIVADTDWQYNESWQRKVPWEEIRSLRKTLDEGKAAEEVIEHARWRLSLELELPELCRLLEDDIRDASVVKMAHLLCMRQRSKFTSVPDLTGNLLETMPADAAPEWKAACVELATAILAHDYKPSTMMESAERDRRKRFDQTVEQAKTFLARMNVRQLSQQERERRLAKLRAEAALLGVDLVEQVCQ